MDLELQREKSFGTFAKELTGLWGDNQESSLMLDTPKGPQKQGHFLGVTTVPDTATNLLQETILLRCDSKEVFGQPLTRSKSKECLLQVSDAIAAVPTNSATNPNSDANRLTRSKSKENLTSGNAKPNNSTDLVRADSLLGGLGFDMSDLLGSDFAGGSLAESFAAPKAPAPANPAPANPSQGNKNNNNTHTKLKRKSGAGSGQGGKKAKSSSNKPSAKGAAPESEDPAHDPWIAQKVKLTRGKYEGRTAFVLGRTEKKYQVQVEGVAYQLEFYGSMFVRPEDYRPAQPKKCRGKKATDDRQLSFGLTASQNDISSTKSLV